MKHLWLILLLACEPHQPTPQPCDQCATAGSHAEPDAATERPGFGSRCVNTADCTPTGGYVQVDPDMKCYKVHPSQDYGVCSVPCANSDARCVSLGGTCSRAATGAVLMCKPGGGWLP